MFNKKCTSSIKSSLHTQPNKHMTKDHKTQRKVIPSKKIIPNCIETKCHSASVVMTKRCPVKAKKTTASDVAVTKKYSKISMDMDYCKKCGDADEKTCANVNKIIREMNVKSVRNDNNLNNKIKTPQNIQQYYKNKNFKLSTESVNINNGDIRKSSLDTINEVSELNSCSDDSLFMIYSDSDEDVTYLDPDDDENIEKLKQFRNKNYFECHSAKSRIKHQLSGTSLTDHKCVYRFYLNDRLFPVPLNTDYNNKIRCVECQLPMDIGKDSKDDIINGTIQAKVKLGNETQDMVLLLPVKESLIITERRKEEKVDDKYVYFGVVKLGRDSNSLFNRAMPQDSLALKYQKGYKELRFDERYRYKNIDENDLIVI